jgi:hypothetical protein
VFHTNKYFIIFVLTLFLSACGGGGGTSDTASSNPPPVVTPPVTSSCTNPHNADYPVEYNGKFETPSPRSELASSIVRSISFKDYSPSWIYDGLPLSTRDNCSRDEYVELMYLEALQAMSISGAQRFWIYNYGDWNDSQEPWVVDEAKYHTPKKYVEYIVEQANLLDIEVYFSWQFTQTNNDREIIVEQGEDLTLGKLKILLDAHQNNIIIQAKHAQEIGIKGIAADWNAMWVTLHTDELKDYYIERFSEIIDDISANFDGEIVWGQIGTVYNDQRIFSRVDSIVINALQCCGNQFNAEEDANLTTELIKQKTFESLAYQHSQIYCDDINQPCWHGTSDIDLPITLVVQVQSREDFFLNGWKEDGFCTPGTLEDGTEVSCIQESFVTDFSVQSVGIEGIMQAIEEQDTFMINSVDIHTGYWLSQTLIPSFEGFPNISQSVRGKPAEGIIKYWYTGQE